MTNKFNAIERIRTNSEITNKSQAYINACDEFEKQASLLLNSGSKSIFLPQIVEEVSYYFDKAKKSGCEYSIYAAAHACEIWFSKAYSASLVS